MANKLYDPLRSASAAAGPKEIGGLARAARPARRDPPGDERRGYRRNLPSFQPR